MTICSTAFEHLSGFMQANGYQRRCGLRRGIIHVVRGFSVSRLRLPAAGGLTGMRQRRGASGVRTLKCGPRKMCYVLRRFHDALHDVRRETKGAGRGLKRHRRFNLVTVDFAKRPSCFFPCILHVNLPCMELRILPAKLTLIVRVRLRDPPANP